MKRKKRTDQRSGPVVSGNGVKSRRTRYPFNNWTNDHVRQGFAWRDKAVSFKTMEDSGDLACYVRVLDSFEEVKRSLRSIRVPFTIGGDGSVSIAGIMDEKQLKLPTGEYALHFDTMRDDPSAEAMIAVFSFCRHGEKTPAILKANRDIWVPEFGIYLMEADPA
jgi:hypothetical protein